MGSKKVPFHSIDEYIASFPEETQKILEEVRATIKASAPDAEEKISYQMPTFALKGNLVHSITTGIDQKNRKFRVAENLRKAETKSRKKRS